MYSLIVAVYNKNYRYSKTPILHLFVLLFWKITLFFIITVLITFFLFNLMFS